MSPKRENDVKGDEIQESQDDFDGIYEELGGILRRRLHLFSKRKLAEQAGVSASYLSTIMSQNTSKTPSIRFLFKVCSVAGIKVSDLIIELEERMEKRRKG